jgi:hypothetical protein
MTRTNLVDDAGAGLPEAYTVLGPSSGKEVIHLRQVPTKTGGHLTQLLAGTRRCTDGRAVVCTCCMQCVQCAPVPGGSSCPALTTERRCQLNDSFIFSTPALPIPYPPPKHRQTSQPLGRPSPTSLLVLMACFRSALPPYEFSLRVARRTHECSTTEKYEDCGPLGVISACQPAITVFFSTPRGDKYPWVPHANKMTTAHRSGCGEVVPSIKWSQ